MLADVRHRAPMLTEAIVDYGVLPDLTGFSLKLAWILAHGLLARELRDTGITPLRFSVLEMVGCNPGLMQMQLATALALSRPATTLALDFWEQRQCIERRKVESDRRSFGVHLTPAGEQELARLRPIVVRADDALTRDLTDAERLQLHRLLRKIHL